MAAGAGCLTGLLVALVAAAPAAAVTGDRPAGVLPALTEPQLRDAFLDVARSYWPGAPCTGRETVELDAGAAIDPVDPGAQALAFPEECRVAVRGGMPPTEFCVTVAHELGHLAGHAHTTTGLMSERAAEVGPCVAAAAAAEFSHEWRRAIADLPGGGARWTVTRSTRARDDGATTYVAARRGFLRRVILELPPGEASFRRAAIGPMIVPQARPKAQQPTRPPRREIER